MTERIILEFDDPHEADLFRRGLEAGHVDGRRLITLQGSVRIVTQAQAITNAAQEGYRSGHEDGVEYAYNQIKARIDQGIDHLIDRELKPGDLPAPG